MPRAPVICITHGGGPMPIVGPMLGDKGHFELNTSLQTRIPSLLKLGTPDAPRAIVVITPHWRPDFPTITATAEPLLYHDFEPSHPPQSFEIEYKAPGAPDVAEAIYEALKEAGLEPVKDTERGWDHGIFVPFILINPKGDIPLVQLSILPDDDPIKHFKMGRALAKLRDDNVAILGSGFASFHNGSVQRSLYFADPQGEEVQLWRGRVGEWNRALADVVLSGDPRHREEGLRRWRELPHSFDMHPDGEAEHLMPLMVCAGAADHDRGDQFSDNFGGVEVASHYWGVGEVGVAS
ncbi:Extradiol ring-cleavage dioxygenase [Colletotrichum sidae]|uniref:Extradiol ring-cleavage dioxygenase n=1 Tax=Colletotrichum sidae TaxID=1347389 RepID=A0A4R8THH2_9PEZI|nr:Extradiol ring-cleavage dioxygenase [Colletotrichum sidae]